MNESEIERLGEEWEEATRELSSFEVDHGLGESKLASEPEKVADASTQEEHDRLMARAEAAEEAYNEALRKRG